ncbi:C4-type zinc ribbon domain-containing protein [uncultured Pseudodesulfovibrio sp.]|uniref:zinc ribbon domain-containing protein n=1 Tax=uncultured Pseudodesulfovibrio sp. TaxID=2035858 RepID=UPI0029C6EE7F|nr:C4-type zinc ribbon domain-containing protein [uncultured Pseudodesulfovibrio sp.]
MYQKQIEQLIVLQQVDDEILTLRDEIEQAPKELSHLEGQMSEFDERRNQIDEKTGILKEQQKKLTFEIDEDAGKIKKSKNKLMLVGNTKEYHAMMREMDSLEKLNRMRDDEQEAVREELIRQDEATESLTEEMSGVKEQYDALKTTLDERLAKAQKKLESLGRKRKKSSKAVPPPILGRYEFIRERMENPVIVPVSKGVCAGCNIMIPPQSFNDLQKGHQILSCPNCQRLIYWKAHIEPESQD